LFDARPRSLERFDQGPGAAIAQAHPQQTRGAFGAAGEIQEVFIFGHDHGALVAGVLPYFRVGGRVQVKSSYVLAFMTEGNKVVCQRDG